MLAWAPLLGILVSPQFVRLVRAELPGLLAREVKSTAGVPVTADDTPGRRS